MRRIVAVLAACAALVGSGADARAEETPAFTIGPKPSWFLTGGATGGGTLVAKGSGYIGGELSVLRLSRGRFAGLYGDGYYDFGAHRTYTTGGIELGYKFLGIDGGVAGRIGSSVHSEWGPTGRLFVTIGFVTIYGRYAYFPESVRADSDHVVQIGGLLKLPFLAWGAR